MHKLIVTAASLLGLAPCGGPSDNHTDCLADDIRSNIGPDAGVLVD